MKDLTHIIEEVERPYISKKNRQQKRKELRAKKRARKKKSH